MLFTNSAHNASFLFWDQIRLYCSYKNGKFQEQLSAIFVTKMHSDDEFVFEKPVYDWVDILIL